MSEKCGVAIVGYGGMAHCWHIVRLQEMTDSVQIMGAYDISEERRRVFKKETGIDAYSSMAELENDPNVELVIVATPNDTHRDICIELMQHGKNVICEKPVTLSSADLDAMISASERSGVIFTVHQNRRWDEDYLTAKKVFDQNLLGPVFRIESRVTGSRGIPDDWRSQKAHGGGMVFDWGIHLFDQIFCLTDWRDDIVSVYSELTHVTNGDVDDGFYAWVRFRSGLTAHIEVGTSNFIDLPRWYMLGQNGSMVIDDWNLHGKIVKVTDWENRDAVPVVTAAGVTKTMAPRTDETIAEEPLPQVQSDIRGFYKNVLAACRGQEELIVKPEHVRRTMKLMEAVFESAQDNKVIHDVI